MTDLYRVNIEKLLRKNDSDLRAALEAMLLKPSRRKNLLGRWAKHPVLGDVVVMSDVPNNDGVVSARPVTPPAHPEYLETIEDYRNAPVGTIVERPSEAVSGQYLIKLDAPFYQSWKAPGLSGYCIDKDLAGTRRRVIYWPVWEEE